MPKLYHAYQHTAALLKIGERDVTKVYLEFLKNVTPVCEEFLTVFQKSTPTVHLVYDAMCRTLTRLMRRFLKSDTLKEQYCDERTEISCDVQLQLPD